ncbi:hypothetical protein D3C87_1392610 [compost metagenome]
MPDENGEDEFVDRREGLPRRLAAKTMAVLWRERPGSPNVLVRVAVRGTDPGRIRKLSFPGNVG